MATLTAPTVGDGNLSEAELSGTVVISGTITDGPIGAGNFIGIQVPGNAAGDGYYTAQISGDTYTLEISGNLLRADDGTAIAVAQIRSSDINLPNGDRQETEYQIDTIAPTVTVAITDASLNNADTQSVVTFTFSEAPADFDNTDLAVVGGTLSTVTVDGSDPTIYTATFTASANSNGTASISVNSGSYADAAGNPGAWPQIRLTSTRHRQRLPFRSRTRR